ncbi:putative transcription elognation factor eaf [Diplodia seriata]|uniref:Putative transcription elognation factor eaf n=1 Tax=Diplodia seriata TaxID=420778 RepID=A0A0G2E5I6_9PEZI|nr:putative transcription elognation factor eaf [Diplodia seriata]
MASPHPAEAPVAINPHQNARYTLKLSERITNPSQDQSRFRTVKFNHKPTQAAGNARTTTMKPASSGDDQFTLCIRDKEKDAPANTSTFEYTGQRKELKKTYVLVFDKDTQTATLEPLDETYAFNLKSAPDEKDPAKLAEKYQLVRPRNEKPDRDAAANDDADDLFSDGSATPRSTAESMFGGGSFSEDEEPDESNPFDFRHFLKDAEQSEGFASPYSHSGTPLRTTTNATTTASTTTAPARSTPLPLTERPKTKPAPKAAPKQAIAKQTAAASSRKRKSPEPEQAVAKPKPSSPTSTRTKQQPTPSIRLDRRASTRPTDSAVAAASDALSASAPGAARSQQSSASSTKSSSRTSREPSADEDDDGDDDDDQFGGLEIDWGGSGGAAGGKSGSSRHGRQRRSIALAFEQSVTGDGPVSLRSAADSASPNSRLHTPNMHATTAITSKNAPDVIDFGGEGGSGDEEEGEYEDDDAGHRHHHQREADHQEQEEEEEDDDDGYAEDDEDADGDVDPLTLGSPAADTLQQQQSREEEEETNDFGDEQQQQQHQMVEGDDDDDDGAGDFEDDFEAEMAQALASAAEEGDEDGGRVMHEESEEESEEE